MTTNDVPKPQTHVRVIVLQDMAGFLCHVYALGDEAETWARQEAARFGVMTTSHHGSAVAFYLRINLCFCIQDIVEYLESFVPLAGSSWDVPELGLVEIRGGAAWAGYNLPGSTNRPS